MTKEEIKNLLQNSTKTLENSHKNSTVKIKKKLEDFKKKTTAKI